MAFPVGAGSFPFCSKQSQINILQMYLLFIDFKYYVKCISSIITVFYILITTFVICTLCTTLLDLK